MNGDLTMGLVIVAALVYRDKVKPLTKKEFSIL